MQKPMISMEEQKLLATMLKQPMGKGYCLSC
nr:MAG TPA: hypothetical protein [Caudoviricetes sp.]